jgi:hypothetical protein
LLQLTTTFGRVRLPLRPELVTMVAHLLTEQHRKPAPLPAGMRIERRSPAKLGRLSAPLRP